MAHERPSLLQDLKFCRGNGGEEAGYNTRDVQLAMHPTNGPLNDAGASQKKDSSRSPRKDGHSVPIQALAVDF